VIGVIDSGRSVNVVAFSPDGSRFVTGVGNLWSGRPRDRGVARVWSARTGEAITSELWHDSPVIHAHFAPDSRRVVTAQNQIGEIGIARIWDAQTGQQVGTDLPQGSLITSVRFSPEGSRVVTSSELATARLWDTDTGKAVGPPMWHGTWVKHAAFSPDGLHLATACEDRLVRIWALVTAGGPEQVFQGARVVDDEQEVVDVQLSPDGKSVLVGFTGANQGSARLLDIETGADVIPKMRNPKGNVGRVEVSSDGTRVVLAPHFLWWGTNAVVFDLTTGEQLFEVTHEQTIAHAEFNPHGDVLLTIGGDRVARVWDATRGFPLGPELLHDSIVYHGSFAPDRDQVVTACRDGTVQVWDWRTGDKVLPDLRHDQWVSFAVYTPDGRRIVSAGGDQLIRIWDALTGEPAMGALNHPGAVHGVVFRPDNRVFVSRSGAPYAFVWDAKTGVRLTPPLIHEAGLSSARFSPDGRLIATASFDETVRLWDAATGEMVAVPFQHGGPVYQARFDPRESRILTASQDGAARIWRFGFLDWPMDDVVALVDAFCGHEIDTSLTLARLTTSRITASFATLRKNQPEYLLDCGEQRLNWHRTEAHQAELTKRWSAAHWHLDALLANNPRDGDLYSRRGDAAAELGRWEGAIHDFTKAVELGERNLTKELLLASLRVECWSTSRWAAQEMVRNGVEDESRRNRAAYWTTIVAGLLDDYATPIQFADQRLEREPDSMGGHVTRMMLNYRTGQISEAVRLLESVPLKSWLEPPLARETPPSLPYSAAMVWAEAGELDRARAMLALAIQRERWWRDNPTEPVGWLSSASWDLRRAEVEARLGGRVSD
jgi:WD40 repeat protein/tetratricopeptide (TPR) repeat protein